MKLHIHEIILTEINKLNGFSNKAGTRLGFYLLVYDSKVIVRTVDAISTILLKNKKTNEGTYYYNDILSYLENTKSKMENNYRQMKNS